MLNIESEIKINFFKSTPHKKYFLKHESESLSVIVSSYQESEKIK